MKVCYSAGRQTQDHSISGAKLSLCIGVVLKFFPLTPTTELWISMIIAKKEFHRQAQEARTPAAKVLFSKMEAKAEGFEDVPTVPLLSLFKPSIDVSLPGLIGRGKKMAKHVHLAEDSMLAMTHNLIYQRGALMAQDKILRGLEARLDHVQDHLGVTPIRLSSDFEAPTIKGQVALLAGKSILPFGKSQKSCRSAGD
jgi:hypothetical protein